MWLYDATSKNFTKIDIGGQPIWRRRDNPRTGRLHGKRRPRRRLKCILVYAFHADR